MDSSRDIEALPTGVSGAGLPASPASGELENTLRALRMSASFAGLLLSLVALFWLLTPSSSPHEPFFTVNQDILDRAVPARTDTPSPLVSQEKVANAWHLIDELKKHNLWEIKSGKTISPFLLSSFPKDLETLSIREKKKAFLNSLLPAALVANQDVLRERELLLNVLDKIPFPIEKLTFGSRNRKSWQPYLDGEEISFVKSLTKKYRAKKATQLLQRVNIIPVSLILAQGALESSWGTSRFSKEGNSLFGLWTWNTNGMVPLSREDGKTHRVEAYDSILASLKKYILTLNRLDPYADFRARRSVSLDPYELAEGLQLYSERGEDYINDIKRVISSNSLTVYDTVLFPSVVLVSLSGPNPYKAGADSFAEL